MRKIIISLLLLVAMCAFAQVTTEPAIIQQGYTGQVKFIFNPNEGDKGMVGATECYLYSCVEVNASGKWEYQLAAWPSKSDKTKMTKNGSNWEITIPNLYTFYGVPENMTITRLLLLFTDGKNDGKVGRGAGGADIILKLAPKGLSASIVSTLGEITTQGSSAVLNSPSELTASAGKNGINISAISNIAVSRFISVTPRVSAKQDKFMLIVLFYRNKPKKTRVLKQIERGYNFSPPAERTGILIYFIIFSLPK